jgi:acetyl/propionyl-CoA carboxylase alpha subunit
MGSVVIRKVLVANRGEIAIRIFHTLRSMGIQTVAVYTDPDANALHVRFADESRPVSSYLDADEIARAAAAIGADAIHPGYGFLSEAPALPAACEAAGIVFIGPAAETIRAMGDKVEAKARMQRAGIPVVPMWPSDPPAEEYPVLVKATGGGGGKGMRLVERPADLKPAMEAASREAAAAFGDGRVFIEKYVNNPRHIEVQVLGDAHGNVIHVFERECSIQRRHQKIIEESPSPAVGPELRAALGAAAVKAAAAVSYRGAGTIEFILNRDRRFYFLEMNTRLQVEHPVTEMTTGLDLVWEQIRIADGQPLSVPQSDLHQIGHALECRIYAEVPEENFRPATGTIAVYRPPSGPGIRLDSGVEQGSVVGIHFDPILAKLIAWGPSRQAAIARMQRALKEFVILGVRTNIEFLERVISSDAFGDGAFDTQLLERHPELFQEQHTELPPAVLVAASLASVAPAAKQETAASSFKDVWNSGSWRNA